MDLLSIVGQATKKRGDYFPQAIALAKSSRTLENLEKKTKKQAKLIAKSLQSGEVRFEEYAQAMVDKTIVSALAAVYLGAGNSAPEAKLEKAWPTVIGNMLPPLVDFLNQTEIALQNGTLIVGADLVEFSEEFGFIDEEDGLFEFGTPPQGQKLSWRSLISRVIRYISNPGFSFFNVGEFYVRQEQGFKEMRRVPIFDRRTCKDCIRFGGMGWQPIGSLPMPGQDCRCFDNCRCQIEYR